MLVRWDFAGAARRSLLPTLLRDVTPSVNDLKFLNKLKNNFNTSLTQNTSNIINEKNLGIKKPDNISSTVREVIGGIIEKWLDLWRVFGDQKKQRMRWNSFRPSHWKWYHRNGYWASRKKKGVNHFNRYARTRYHECRFIRADRKLKWWQDRAYYRPKVIKEKYRFW
eukprot:GHVL01028039.1.p1 GENE.GHVL01028039.1~~GHVL01028039.1.p1  ORF type:complete len:167 (-),score=30.57 GHVL01028039.1:454-954(-)